MIRLRQPPDAHESRLNYVPTYSDKSRWSGLPLAGKVSADPAQRVVTHVDGPTLYERELTFGRGIASADRAPTCFGRSNPTYITAGPGRSFRSRALIALVVLACGSLLTACGGGEEAPAPAPDAAAGASTPAATPTAPDPAATGTPVGDTTGAVDPITGAATTPATTGASPGGEVLSPGDQVKTTKATPSKFVDALGKQSILVVFYQPGIASSDLLIDEINVATAKRKNVLVLAYTPAQYKDSGDLAAQLGLFDLPALAIIDRAGNLQNYKAVYWPSNLIAEALDKANAAKSAKVSPSDAPPGDDNSGLEEMVSDTATGAAATTAGTGTSGAATDGTTAPPPADVTSG